MYLSGHTVLDPPSSTLVVWSIAEQTGQCFRSLIAVLEAAGLTSDHVVKCNAYLADMNDFAEFDAAYGRHFTGTVPDLRNHRSCGLVAWCLRRDREDRPPLTVDRDCGVATVDVTNPAVNTGARQRKRVGVIR